MSPILARSCSPCHFPGGKEAKRSFSTYADVFPQRGAMLDQLVACEMPPSDGPTLTAEDRGKVVAWLACGARND